MFLSHCNKNNPQLSSCFSLSSDLLLYLAPLHSSHCFSSFQPPIVRRTSRQNLGTFQQDDYFPYTPSPQISLFFFANVFPLIQSYTVSQVRRLSHPSKMADWKTKVKTRCFVCKKIRKVNRGLTDERHAGFDLYFMRLRNEPYKLFQ